MHTVGAGPDQDRTFEARYGEAIVSTGIATIPALLLRYQSPLRLKDGHVVLLGTVFSFYSSPLRWPSVSIEKMAKWRGLSWKRVEKEVKELEALGYLVRTGRDPKHGRSYFFDLSPLLKRLTKLAIAEAESNRLRREQTRVLEGALLDLSTDGEANRGHKQRTGTEEGIEKQEEENANSVHMQKDIQKPQVDDANSFSVQRQPTIRSPKPLVSLAERSDLFVLSSDDGHESVDEEGG